MLHSIRNAIVERKKINETEQPYNQKQFHRAADWINITKPYYLLKIKLVISLALYYMLQGVLQRGMEKGFA
jgi:hypothetical protein